MTTKIKLIAIGGLLGGVIYAGIIAGLDYKNGLDFNTVRVLVSFIVFGALVAYITAYGLKKRQNEK
ncbi:hypothetical protein [Winogradskyella wichelsiae]|uniref:hypothetical protein n=1 Tax=Winogradskyella wichelsiae TaxID=2697007 RepID=UPI0015C6BE05|nr:hypothetical protein [Winogradskyella wichelsiae]